MLEDTSSGPETPNMYCRHRQYRLKFPRENIAEDTDGSEGQVHLVRVRVYQRVLPKEVELDSDSDVADLE